MPPTQITDKAELDSALGSARFVLFKHSLVCPISTHAFSQYETFVAANPDVPTGWIDVIGQRPWSQEVAARTGIEHQSPQALVIQDGAVAWHASHNRITQATLEEAVKP